MLFCIKVNYYVHNYLSCFAAPLFLQHWAESKTPEQTAVKCLLIHHPHKSYKKGSSQKLNLKVRLHNIKYCRSHDLLLTLEVASEDTVWMLMTY